MHGNIHFAEKCQVVSAFEPVDLNSSGQNGDYVCLKNYHRCAVVFHGNVGSSGTDITLTLQQATDVSGSGVKALNFTRIDSKEGANLAAVGTYTTTTQAAANTYTVTNNEQLEQIYIIDFKADDLDVANGFDCLRVTVNAVGAAKVGGALYILHDPKYSTDPLPTAITN